MAANPGEWTWISGSNQQDNGLKRKKGGFIAEDWTEAEKIENPLRRCMIKGQLWGEYNCLTIASPIG